MYHKQRHGRKGRSGKLTRVPWRRERIGEGKAATAKALTAGVPGCTPASMDAPDTPRLSATIRVLFSDLMRANSRKFVLGMLLGAASASLEGVGLVLLLPLLSSTGVAAGEAPLALARLSAGLDLAWLLALWVAVMASLAMLAARRDVAMVRMNCEFIRHLQFRLHHALLEMEWSAFALLRGSDLVLALTGNPSRVGLGVAGLIQLMGAALLLVIHAAIALYIAPAAAAVALLAGGGLAVAQVPRLRRMARHGAAQGVAAHNMQAVISEHMAAMKLARCHSAEPQFTAAFEREITALGDSVVATVADQATGRVRLRISAALLMAAVAWGGVHILNLTGSHLLLLVAVFARLLPTVGNLMQAAQRVVEMLPAYAAIESLRQQAVTASSPQPVANGVLPGGDVSLRGVSYGWPGRERPTVAAIDLDIASNRTTALVGPSGAGKSTLADLCLGLLEPTTGTIQIGGTPLTGTARPSWRQRVAVVPQDVFLFHDTVRANLTWASPDAAEDDLWRVLDTAAAADLVRGLPQGLETLVGDRGVRLSGGERQRLALARALLRRPDFLVLDEATSHLDRGNERLIQTALERLHGQMTVLVIAHRLATVRHADRIYVIEDGRVVEQGGWDQLLAHEGWLARSAAEWG